MIVVNGYSQQHNKHAVHKSMDFGKSQNSLKEDQDSKKSIPQNVIMNSDYTEKPKGIFILCKVLDPSNKSIASPVKKRSNAVVSNKNSDKSLGSKKRSEKDATTTKEKQENNPYVDASKEGTAMSRNSPMGKDFHKASKQSSGSKEKSIKSVSDNKSVHKTESDKQVDQVSSHVFFIFSH